MSEPIPIWPGEEISLGDRSVFVRSAPGSNGSGPAEAGLYVHGLAGSATNWTDLMAQLSDVLAGDAIDLPGFGYSPPPPDRDYSVDAHARTVAQVIERRGRGPVHLFGNSLGGAVATRLAARRPDLVRTLTLISPALPDLRPRLGPSRILVASVPGVGEWALRRVLAVPPERRVKASLEMIYSDPSLMHPARLRELIAEIRRRDALDYSAPAVLGAARGIVSEFLRRGRRSLWRDAARVQAPTLLLYGGRDRIVDARMAGRAYRIFPHARVVVLPGVGHVAQMERPELVAREFRALLADSREAGLAV
ncbi:MAG TPA: alpha/beta fold hydrolase [Streptosporangiaceae bacterium]|jgi:pimeloyl-ACP methyl ester carboxylesterase